MNECVWVVAVVMLLIGSRDPKRPRGHFALFFFFSDWRSLLFLKISRTTLESRLSIPWALSLYPHSAEPFAPLPLGLVFVIRCIPR